MKDLNGNGRHLGDGCLKLKEVYEKKKNKEREENSLVAVCS